MRSFAAGLFKTKANQAVKSNLIRCRLDDLNQPAIPFYDCTREPSCVRRILQECSEIIVSDLQIHDSEC